MLLTVRQAAERLGVSAGLIYHLRSARKLRHERHGLRRGTIRIPEGGLDEYRRRQAVGVEQGASVPPKLNLKPIRL
jgi:excisionase family DNA binding protein